MMESWQPLCSPVKVVAITAITLSTLALATSDDMGPAAFMWPPDRNWNADKDNTAPCGSSAGVTNRTEFPLNGGEIALVAQDDSYYVRISRSFENNPTSNDDFTTLIDGVRIEELDPGHTCFSIQDPPSSVPAGANATLQMVYTADFDQPENQTFYACADITYIKTQEWETLYEDTLLVCFNATNPEDVPAPSSTGIPSDLPGHADTDDDADSTGSTSIKNSKLSGGAIAGIVIGSVAGVALFAGMALLWYRDRQKKTRLEEQRDNPRAIKLQNIPSARTSAISA